jgi:hypothetical protein
MGVPVNNPGSNRENCPKISTACVIWQGPDIPCIDLCAGDAVDEVVFKLATYVCELSENIFNIDNVDFSCLISPTDPRPVLPTNLEELIQFLIEYVCNNSGSSAPLLRVQENEPVVILPPELAYYDDNGDYITVLRQSQYSAYIASKLVETISLLDTTEGKANTSETDIIALQVQIDDLPTSSTNDIYVVSQCASSGTPGQQILIQNAFTTFERNYCNLTSVIGTSTTLYRGINSQIANLSNLSQLMNSALQMRAIPRWSDSVNDIGTSISNLWLTVTDMRNRMIQISNATFDVPCVLLSPEDITVGTIGTVSTQIYWEKPSIAGVQPPTSYVVEVFNTSDTSFLTPLFSETSSENGDPNVSNVGNISILAEVIYVVHVSAIYKCGISRPISLLTKLKSTTVNFEVRAVITTLPDVPLTCTDSLNVDTNYDLIQKTIRFDLYNSVTDALSINATPIPITIIARFDITSCDFGGETVNENITFEIQPGDNFSNTYEFVAEKLTNCLDGSCGAYEKELSCGVFVSDPTIQFDPTYGSC